MKLFTHVLAPSFLIACATVLSAQNILPDAAFSRDNGWTFWISRPAADAGASGSFDDGKAVVKCPAGEELGLWSIQLSTPLEVNPGRIYKVKFKASAGKAGKLQISYGLNLSPFSGYGGAAVDLAPGEEDYECTLGIGPDKEGNYEGPRALRFVFGNFKDTTVSISNVSFEESK